MNTTTLSAPTIKCNGCVNNVKAVLSRQPGVSNVQVELPTRQVTIDYDAGATSPEKLAGALSAAGYPNEPPRS